jgi:hypothetical protein
LGARGRLEYCKRSLADQPDKESRENVAKHESDNGNVNAAKHQDQAVEKSKQGKGQQVSNEQPAIDPEVILNAHLPSGRDLYSVTPDKREGRTKEEATQKKDSEEKNTDTCIARKKVFNVNKTAVA